MRVGVPGGQIVQRTLPPAWFAATMVEKQDRSGLQAFANQEVE